VKSAGPSLQRYREKRRFDETPEPRGKKASAGRIYVIQKHHATRLHYDLRLEHDGALLSWAVPKEPSTDPSVKRLAVRVENHPVEYATFEGQIPKGNYGAGKVEIWDKGSWTPQGDVDKGLEEGKLVFEIEGDRLNGSYALVRMETQKGKENWLLMKHDDEGEPAPNETDYDFMLCRIHDTPPRGAEWIHEIKWDGYRALAFVRHGKCELRTRGGQTMEILGVQDTLGRLAAESLVIDGELVSLDKKGHSDFGALQAALADKKLARVAFVAFDLLEKNGMDLRRTPLENRRKLLQDLLPEGNPSLRFSEAFPGDGPNVYGAACQLGLEGVISKRKGSHYEGGRHSAWVKVKCKQDETLLVGGFTAYAANKNAIGSLLLGEMVDEKFEYRGKVGTGFSDEERIELRKRLADFEIGHPALVNVDPVERRRAKWVSPNIAVRIHFLEKTSQGRVRQASYRGWKMAKETTEVKSVKLTSGERVIDAVTGATKRQVADYYEAVADLIAPHLLGRPISMMRCPDGVAHGCFIQRHPLDANLPGLSVAKITDDHGDVEDYASIDGKEGILAMVQFGTIEFHPWGSRTETIDRPDRLIFDIDPDSGVRWRKIIEATELIAERLRSLGLVPFAKLSGGKGVHVVCPVQPEYDWDEVKAFTKTFVDDLVRQFPDDFIGTMSKEKRKGKMFIDYLRNTKSATAVAPYSLRARPGLGIALPIEWEDLPKFDTAHDVTILNYNEYVGKHDPWKDMDKKAKSLKKILA